MGRFLRVFTPFIVLLIGVLIFNYKIVDSFFSQQPSNPTTTQITREPIRVDLLTTPLANDDQKSIATAIANATAMPTASPQATSSPTSSPAPTMLPENMVTLSGPPVDSRFPRSVPISFYWYSDRDLTEGESFALVLTNDSEEKSAGSLSEPNMGNAYQINFVPEADGLSAGDYFWMIKIIDQESGSTLGESETRSITLIDNEN
ncbi:MAG: hypothetical protein ACK2U0_09460 [Candidatus Promineifilaceae bacterium]|jgi:hypothetical protein